MISEVFHMLRQSQESGAQVQVYSTARDCSLAGRVISLKRSSVTIREAQRLHAGGLAMVSEWDTVIPLKSITSCSVERNRATSPSFSRGDEDEGLTVLCA